MEQLLAHGAEPNLPDKNGQTLLMLAQQDGGHPDIIALLKYAGARK